jgi:hypothetical protein
MTATTTGSTKLATRSHAATRTVSTSTSIAVGVDPRVVIGVGIMGVLVAALLPWYEVPPHTTMSGLRTAQTVLNLGDHLAMVPPTWIGVAWFVQFVATAALLPIVVLAPRRVAATFSFVIGSAAFLSSVTFILVAGRASGLRLAGPSVQLLSAALAQFGSVVLQRPRRR